MFSATHSSVSATQIYASCLVQKMYNLFYSDSYLLLSSPSPHPRPPDNRSILNLKKTEAKTQSSPRSFAGLTDAFHNCHTWPMSDFTVLACHDGKNSNKAKNITAEKSRFICQIKWGFLFVVVVVATFTTGKK